MKKIFSINIPGPCGYSFAVKCESSYNEETVIDLAYDNDLFMDESDANYAIAEDITNSEYDINGLKNATFEL